MTSALVVGMSSDRLPVWEAYDYDTVLGLPWDPEWANFDLLFEMHDRSLWERRGADYLEKLKNVWQPLYMQQHFEDIPNSHSFPFDVIDHTYYNSSLAYMMGYLSRFKKLKRVDIVGCALRDEEEYGYQRPNMEYWIGVLRGQGKEVNVLGDSALLEFCPNISFLDEVQTYKEKYGYLR